MVALEPPTVKLSVGILGALLVVADVKSGWELLSNPKSCGLVVVVWGVVVTMMAVMLDTSKIINK